MKLFGGVIPITGITFFMFSVFAIIAVGFALGRIKVKGISLGDAGVFIVALLFGCLFYKDLEAQLPVYTEKALKIVENLGLILFVTSVGFIAGPKFFGNFKKNFKSYVVLALVVVLMGGLTAVGCIFFGRGVMGETNHEEFTAMVVGLLSGALTSTPAFSAAKATVDASYEGAVSVGHGIAYIFGVVGIVLFMQIIPKLSHADMELERQKLAEAFGDGEKESQTEKKRSFLNIDSHGFGAFALAAIVGVFVGMIKIPLTAQGLSGTCFSLTTTGGCLLSSLVFGHFAHVGPINVTPEESTLKIFKAMGLTFFLVGAGVAGGAEFVELFKFSYFIYGVVMTTIPLTVGFIFAKYVLKFSLLNNLGSLTGARTSTPALGMLIGVSKTDDVTAAYAATYPVALIAVVLVSQLLIVLF